MNENDMNYSGSYHDDSTYHYVYKKPMEDPWQEKKPKKDRRFLKSLALLLVTAILGGCIGAGLMAAFGGRGFRSGRAEIMQSGRTVKTVEIKKIDGKTEMTPAEVYAANVNAAVSINVEGSTTNIFGFTTPTASAGSGFILTADGYIATNYHVIKAANKVKVTLYNGESYDAAVVGGDEDFDVAVIKIEAEDLQPVVLGNSDHLNVGDTVLAVGNPLGELTFSMSSGIASSVNRAINVDGTPFNMIQVDASINHGNSGGPLFNTYGEVVGIVSAKYSSESNTGAEGLGFAIPINDVSAIVEDIMENGAVTDKAYIGIKAYTVNSETVQMYGDLLREGVYISEVEKGSAAAKAGMQAGDIIIKLGDKTVTSMNDLTAAKKNYRAGDTAEFTVFRSGEEVKLSLTFDVAPENSEEDEEPQTQQPQQNYGGDISDYFRYFFGY